MIQEKLNKRRLDMEKWMKPCSGLFDGSRVKFGDSANRT